MLDVFHERLKKALKESKISQSELARRLDVKQSSVWEWLNIRYPSVDHLIEICYTLKISPNYLLGFESMTDEDI